MPGEQCHAVEGEKAVIGGYHGGFAGIARCCRNIRKWEIFAASKRLKPASTSHWTASLYQGHILIKDHEGEPPDDLLLPAAQLATDLRQLVEVGPGERQCQYIDPVTMQQVQVGPFSTLTISSGRLQQQPAFSPEAQPAPGAALLRSL